MAVPAPSKQKTWYETWLPRLTVATLLVLVVGFGGSWVFTSISDFLITLIIAFFLAFAMLPAVDWLSRRGWKRGAATGIVMLGGAGIFGVFVFAIGNVFIGQLVNLISAIPDMVETLARWANDTFGAEFDFQELGLETSDIAGQIASIGGSVIGGALGFTTTIIGFVFRMLTVALFLFYILADFPKLRATMLRLLPPDQQAHAETIVSVTIDKVGGWVYSRGVLAAFSAAFHFVVFLLIGLPYPLALALWVGVVSQFIPTVGTYLAGVVPVVIALVSGDPFDALWVVIAITLYQQVENYLISPKVTANTMELHPAVAFGSAIVGASLLGGLGALLALPVAATVTSLSQTYTIHHDLIESETFESPQQYETRMREKEAQKAAERGRTRRSLNRLLRRDREDEA
ncbi:MAG: AI-2E family transporter [Acidimicrobiia bacterium]|nr:MAG: AI-2E family transporter [Acidimicrobiia bacterium]